MSVPAATCPSCGAPLSSPSGPCVRCGRVPLPSRADLARLKLAAEPKTDPDDAAVGAAATEPAAAPFAGLAPHLATLPKSTPVPREPAAEKKTDPDDTAPALPTLPQAEGTSSTKPPAGSADVAPTLSGPSTGAAGAPAPTSALSRKSAAPPAAKAGGSAAARQKPSVGSSDPNPLAATRIDPRLDPLIGHLVAGKYRILELIAVGGMGKVYKAQHEKLKRLVCVKTLRPALSEDKTTVGRFNREADAASRLTHPNAITVFDFGEDQDGSLFLAMEFVAGRDLRTLLVQEFPLGEARVCRLLAQVLAALADAHQQGIVHRDLKPENIMVEARPNEPEQVKVLDFGIAKVLDGDAPALTQADRICGTPLYMSPEQATGDTVDARSDLYSVGVILYQLATGVLPFYSENTVEVLTRHVNERPTPPRLAAPEQEISPELEALILKAMAKEPDQRPKSATEFREELLRLARDRDRSALAPTSPPLEMRPVEVTLVEDPGSAPGGEEARSAAAEPGRPPLARRAERGSKAAAAVPEGSLTSQAVALALRSHKNLSRGAVAAGLALVAVVAVFALRSPAKKPPPAPSRAASAPKPSSPPLLPTCPPGMSLVGDRTCIADLPLKDARHRVLGNVTLAAAEHACGARQERLCTLGEWCQAALARSARPRRAPEWVRGGIAGNAAAGVVQAMATPRGESCGITIPVRAGRNPRERALVRCCRDARFALGRPAALP